jgi:D-3-phosphoglycerate dehydrogenase
MHVIWFERPLPPEHQHLLESPVRRIGPMPNEKGDRFVELPEAEAVIAAGGTRYSDELLARAPRLRAICRTGIGFDNIDLAAATRRGIAVCNAPDGPTVSTAEHTMMLLLAVAKRLASAEKKLREGRERDHFNTHDGLELMGLQLGLVGLGRIGRRVARMAAGFDMQVLAFDPYLSDTVFFELGIPRAASLDALLEHADIVSLHVPLTPESRHLIGREHLARMKPNAILINAGRGGLVDEAALLEALQSGRLRGAGLDVFEQEPVSPNNPLLALDNVVATPHIGPATSAGKARLWKAAIGQAFDVLEGRRPAHLVNPEVWPQQA